MRDLTGAGLYGLSRGFMQVFAPAKINLHLRVAPVDGSGFHPVLSWMCTVALFDTLTIESADDGVIALTCDDPSLPCGESNLIIRAARAMNATQGARVHLHKRIPVGGGLGGGSSDAARTLLALNRFWNLNWPIERLARIAASLGSDVPFFLHDASSLCTGRGEIVRPISNPRPKWVVLILPGFAIPTADVYRRFDSLAHGNADSVALKPDLYQWTELLAGPLLQRLVNDLEPPAFDLCPRLADLHRQVQQTLGQIVRMSGSGSSLFTLYDDFSEAQAAAERIKRCHHVIALAEGIAPELKDDLSVGRIG